MDNFKNLDNNLEYRINSILIERFDAVINRFLGNCFITPKRHESIQNFYLQLKRNLPEFSFLNINKELLMVFLGGSDEKKRTQNIFNNPKRDAAKIISAEADLSYMKSGNLVGSYNSDKAAKLQLSENQDADCVRCICGIIEDDGGMTQCDGCHFWLHDDCLDIKIDSSKVFIL